MEQPITSTSSKGITIALILIVYSLAIYFLDIQNTSINLISYAIFFVGVIISITTYGKQIEHNSGFGGYFAHGFKVAALVTAIMIIFMVVFLFAFPEIKEKALDAQREAMNKVGTMSDEQLKQATQMYSKFFMPFAIGGTLLGYIVLGAIAALIGAAVTKKQPVQNHDINQIR